MPAFNSLRARFNLSGFERVGPIVHGIELRLFEDPMAYAIPLWTPPALPVAGSAEQFPVRRIFCVGRNYAEHQKEMGGDGRETPFFFLKSEFALIVRGGEGQRAALGDMIWSVPEQIAFLSEHYTLEPGDIIFTGTPAGVGPVKPGDELLAGIDGVTELKVKIAPAL